VSTHYLVSMFNDEINDVVVATGSPPTTSAVGNYIVRVPDDVKVQNPTSVANLLTQKYAGILGSYGLFTQITYDDFQDATGIDFAGSAGVISGKRSSVGLYPTHGGVNSILKSTNNGIVWGGPGAGPPQAILTYEVYEYVDVDDKTLPFQRSYRELTPDTDLSAEVSFNGGATWISALDKVLINVPSLARGTQLTVRFTRTTDIDVRARVHIGSWAVVY
jgi:hypothetical protein